MEKKNYRQQRPHQPCLIRSAGSSPGLRDEGFLSTCPSYHCVTHSHHRLPFIICCCISHGETLPHCRLRAKGRGIYFLSLNLILFLSHLLPPSLCTSPLPFISSSPVTPPLLLPPPSLVLLASHLRANSSPK